jgi:hypothetical protein
MHGFEWAAARLAGWVDRRRGALPELAVLCMSFERPRQIRMELRIKRPASAPDWAIRRVEWLAPDAVRIAARADAAPESGALDVDLRPRDAAGRWFAGDATLWARYPADETPVHAMRLRLTLERAGGRRRTMTVSAVFPAMDWSGSFHARAPRPRPLIAATPWRLGVFGPAPLGREARSWEARDPAEEVGGAA